MANQQVVKQDLEVAEAQLAERSLHKPEEWVRIQPAMSFIE